MKSTSMDCPYCGRAISQMPPACPACGRTVTRNDYDGYEEEQKEPRWALRLLFSIAFPFIAVGCFLLVIIETLLGFIFAIGGLIAFPSHPVWEGASIACRVSVWLLMIGKGINAAFGE